MIKPPIHLMVIAGKGHKEIRKVSIKKGLKKRRKDGGIIYLQEFYLPLRKKH